MSACALAAACALILLTVESSTASLAAAREGAQASRPLSSFRVMTWNIWKGGRETGRFRGPREVVRTIQEHGADIVLMQETYGSGEILAKGLGFHYLPRGTNVSIFSRFPIVEDVSVFEPFKCVGAIVRLPDGSRVAAYSIWLPYGEDIWLPGVRKEAGIARMLAACQPSADDLGPMLDQIHARLSGPEYSGVPIVVGGDFNSMSHLDYAEVAREHYGEPVEWPTSLRMAQAGYRDAFREAHLAIDRGADRTWSPQFPEQEQDRIDFVYFRGAGLETASAHRVDSGKEPFPSDHAAVVAELRIRPSRSVPRKPSIRAMTYNIRHGTGMEGKSDLARTARAIRAMRPDVVALQEVDDRTARSASVNQAAALGRALGMHAAYGAFMPYGGGWYGLAVLSKYPIVRVRPLRLPDGNEPRVALFVDVRLPDGQTVTVANVHFDWVEDDGFRFAQAQAVADAVSRLESPFILLGDFNDRPGSRTLALIPPLADEAKKRGGKAATFPASEPNEEIDYIFAGPRSRWKLEPAQVVPERLASDHRPVVATLRLLPTAP